MDLSAVSSDDLAAELAHRHDVFFCAGMRDRIEIAGADHEEILTRCSHGETARLLGMIEREKFLILHEDYETSHAPDDEDED